MNFWSCQELFNIWYNMDTSYQRRYLSVFPIIRTLSWNCFILSLLLHPSDMVYCSHVLFVLANHVVIIKYQTMGNMGNGQLGMFWHTFVPLYKHKWQNAIFCRLLKREFSRDSLHFLKLFILFLFVFIKRNLERFLDVILTFSELCTLAYLVDWL